MEKKLCQKRVTSNNEASSFNHSLLYMHLKIAYIRFVYAMNIVHLNIPFTINSISQFPFCKYFPRQFIIVEKFNLSVNTYCSSLPLHFQFRIQDMCFFSPDLFLLSFFFPYSTHFICYVRGAAWSVVDLSVAESIAITLQCSLFVVRY